MVPEEKGEGKMVKVTNEKVFDRTGENRTLLNNILRRKANLIGHISEKKLPPS